LPRNIKVIVFIYGEICTIETANGILLNNGAGITGNPVNGSIFLGKNVANISHINDDLHLIG